MKSSKKLFIMIGIVYAIVFAVINLLIFVIFKPGQIDNDTSKKAFWFSYGFLTVSVLLNFASLFTFDRKSGIDTVFMGIPLFFISIGFFVIETFVAVVFMILAACNVQVPTTLVVVLQIILLAAYLVISILALMAKTFVSDIDKTIKKNVQSIRNLTSDVEVAAEACEDPVVKKALMDLSEDIRYSDPMTNEVVATLDVQIESNVMEIKSAVYDGKYDLAAALIKKGKLYISERNKKLSNSK